MAAAIPARLAEMDRTSLDPDTALREMLEELRPALESPPTPLEPEIGLHVLEGALPYRIKRRVAR